MPGPASGGGAEARRRATAEQVCEIASPPSLKVSATPDKDFLKTGLISSMSVHWKREACGSSGIS